MILIPKNGSVPYHLKLAHDLRGSLTCIQGYSQLLLKSNGHSSQQSRALRCILSRSKLALRLVDDFVNDRAIHTGVFRLDPCPVLLESLLKQAVEDFGILCEVKGISLRPGFLGGDTWVFIDSERIHQVLSNLLANAVRHTHRGGWISVSVVLEREQARIQIQDSGEGVQPKEQKRIFQRFYSSSHNSGILGLGLSICQEVVSRHGGEMGLRSEGMGRGSCFFFTLPLLSQAVLLRRPLIKRWTWPCSLGFVLVSLLFSWLVLFP